MWIEPRLSGRSAYMVQVMPGSGLSLRSVGPPSSRPRGIGISRPPDPSSGSERKHQLAAGSSMSFAKLTGILLSQ